METLHYQNDRIEIEIAPEPFFMLKKFRDRRSGLNLCGSGPQEITADRKLLAACRSEIFGLGKSMSIPIGA